MALTTRRRRARVLAPAAILVAGCCVPCTLQSQGRTAARLPVRVTGRVVDDGGTAGRRRLAFISTASPEPVASAFGFAAVRPDGTFELDLAPGPYRAELHRIGSAEPLAVFNVTVSSAGAPLTLRVPRASATRTDKER